MSPRLAFSASASQFEHKPDTVPAAALARKPATSASYSLIIVMLVYLLFGIVGFFAAAQITL